MRRTITPRFDSVSTDNVGLAKHPEGLELVRIGQPMRPEFAAWRYGDQFGRRRKRAIMYGVGGTVVIGGVILGGAITGVGGAILWQSGNLYNWWANSRTVAKLRTDDGRVLKLKNPDLLGTRLRPGDEADRVQVSDELIEESLRHARTIYARYVSG